MQPDILFVVINIFSISNIKLSIFGLSVNRLIGYGFIAPALLMSSSAALGPQTKMSLTSCLTRFFTEQNKYSGPREIFFMTNF